MLFDLATLERIREGTVTVAFRTWRRPTVRAGGTLRTAAGVLAIDRVDPVDPDTITDADLAASGAADRAALQARLRARPGTTYRIEFRVQGADPRIALRADAALDPEDVAAVRAELDRIDARAAGGPWTAATLAAIAAQPGIPARELADMLGQDTLPFKRRVRRLKELGLTESLEVGYRLSPRGRRVLDASP